jgi:hypothetical protein
MYFEYFFFKPLSYEYFVRDLNRKIDSKPPEEWLSIYSVWVIDYCRKAQYFYQYQYRLHSDITWETFCDQFHIPEYEHPDNIGLDLEWKDWREEYQLDIHYDEYQKAIQSLLTLQKSLESKIKSAGLETDQETISYRDIDRVWFNKIVNNSTQVAEELKILPYEKYLQTSHWKKIRSATMLIRRAVCQAKACDMVDESWYGGTESELDVHHLTYSNRGNERYDDLALLCRYHHGLVHSNLQDRNTPGIELV